MSVGTPSLKCSKINVNLLLFDIIRCSKLPCVRSAATQNMALFRLPILFGVQYMPVTRSVMDSVFFFFFFLRWNFYFGAGLHCSLVLNLFSPADVSQPSIISQSCTAIHNCLSLIIFTRIICHNMVQDTLHGNVPTTACHFL